MAPKTVQELFGLKPEEMNAATVLAGLEGYRGGKGEDVAAVMANLLARRLRGGAWGGVDLRNIAKAPGQYEAVFNYSMKDLQDPAFGAGKLGGESEYNRIRQLINDPSLVGEQFRRSKGAQSFRGVAAYGSKKPQDYVPVPGKSNFYFDPLNQQLYQKGVDIFGRASQPAVVQQGPPTPPPPVSSVLGPILGTDLGKSEKKKSLSQTLLQQFLGNILPAGGIIPSIFGVNQ
jgi:hypothetical protein